MSHLFDNDSNRGLIYQSLVPDWCLNLQKQIVNIFWFLSKLTTPFPNRHLQYHYRHHQYLLSSSLVIDCDCAILCYILSENPSIPFFHLICILNFFFLLLLSSCLVVCILTHYLKFFLMRVTKIKKKNINWLDWDSIPYHTVFIIITSIGWTSFPHLPKLWSCDWSWKVNALMLP